MFSSVSKCEDFSHGTVVKNLPASAGDTRDVGSTPGPGRSPGGGNDNPLQYSCLGNSVDRGAWRATVHGVAKSWMQLSMCTGKCEGTKGTYRSVTSIIFLMKYFIK